MIRDQEFLSKNQFLTFKSKHHHQTFGIYSFSIIHFSYKSVKFMSLVRYISSCIISIIHQVSQVLSTHGDSLLLTDLLLGHHGQYLRLLLDVVRVEGDRGSCNTRISLSRETRTSGPTWEAELYGGRGSEQLVVHRGMRHRRRDSSVVIILVLWPVQIVRPELLIGRGVSWERVGGSQRALGPFRPIPRGLGFPVGGVVRLRVPWKGPVSQMFTKFTIFSLFIPKSDMAAPALKAR